MQVPSAQTGFHNGAYTLQTSCAGDPVSIMMPPSSLSQTAMDALQSKHAAFTMGGYEVDPNYLSWLNQLGLPVSRQSPLVHAGYAIRVACIHRSLQAFCDYYSESESENQQTQLLILGAGMDMTGLWAWQQYGMNVLEVDLPDICRIKAAMLVKMSKLSQVFDERLVFRAQLGHSTYSLVATDLQLSSDVTHMLQFLDPSLPTFILSELVLSYLQPAACDDLLRTLAQGFSHACLVAYEPLGPGDGGATVVAGYKRDFVHQFHQKLQRGGGCGSGALYPLGTSCSQIQQRLHQLGFGGNAMATLAGTAAVAHGFTQRTNELFDEHAALALHLRSYVMITAFSNPSTCHDPVLTQLVRPWICDHGRPIRRRLSNHRTVWLTRIDHCHEKCLRELFALTYRDLASQFPAVRKMVHTALVVDLAVSTNEKECAIHARYRNVGGYYLVVQDIESADKVLGGIGVRRLLDKELGTRAIDYVHAFEIHHLVVDPSVRRLGVGRLLLERAQQVLAPKGNSLWTVTTLLMLNEANGFYVNQGFRASKEYVLGELTYMTYTKEMQRDEAVSSRCLQSFSSAVL